MKLLTRVQQSERQTLESELTTHRDHVSRITKSLHVKCLLIQKIEKPQKNFPSDTRRCMSVHTCLWLFHSDATTSQTSLVSCCLNTDYTFQLKSFQLNHIVFEKNYDVSLLYYYIYFYFLDFHFFQFHSVAIEKLQIQNKHTKQKTNMTITKVLFLSINTIKVNGHHSHFTIPIRVIWLPFCHTKHALTKLLAGNFQTVV